MKKVFISQPMNGLSDLQIEKDKARVIESLYNEGYKPDEIMVIDSFIEENAPDNVNSGLINKPEIKCIGEVVEEHSENDEISATDETENTIMNNLPTTNETGLESQNITNNDYVEDSPLTVTVYTDTTGIEYLVFEHNGAMAVVRREK